MTKNFASKLQSDDRTKNLIYHKNPPPPPPKKKKFAVPKKYKRNAILGDLHRAHKISNNFELEKQRIEKKHLSVNFPYKFIQSTFNSYQQKCESLIRNWLFE